MLSLIAIQLLKKLLYNLLPKSNDESGVAYAIRSVIEMYCYQLEFLLVSMTTFRVSQTNLFTKTLMGKIKKMVDELGWFIKKDN